MVLRSSAMNRGTASQLNIATSWSAASSPRTEMKWSTALRPHVASLKTAP